MGRYRAPAPESSPYISGDGFARLQAEQKVLWAKRKVVVAAITEAAAEGDRSENAEYIYRKKELRGLDRRIGYLKRRMPRLKVVRQKPTNRDQVFFGARVKLEDENGNIVVYQIVGSDEIDAQPENISVDSPVAKSLMGKLIDDEVVVVTPGGQVHWAVIGIEYN